VQAGVFLGGPNIKRPLDRPMHRWEDNIKTDLHEVRWESMDWVRLSQDRDSGRLL
jgi:hypothetical protein